MIPLCKPLMQPGLHGFWTSVLQLLILASQPPWHTQSDGYGPGSAQTGISKTAQASGSSWRKAKQMVLYLWTPYCHIVVVLITKLQAKQQQHYIQ